MKNIEKDKKKFMIDVSVYGSLARSLGGKYVARVQPELNSGAKIKDLFRSLDIPLSEKSYLFINAVLCDMPGLNASIEETLHDGDHVGIFSTGYMWPYQYRDGIRMSNSLKATLQKTGALHHTYVEQPE